MATVHTIPAAASAGDITLRPYLVLREGYAPEDGRVQQLGTMTDRRGDGWHGGEIVIHGQRGAFLAHLAVHSGMLRDLAGKAARLADFIDARELGLPGPCLCTAWSHNLTPCPELAALDYSMCRACWSPEAGQSTLDMNHGAA